MGKAKGTALIGAVKVLRLKKDRARELLPEPVRFYLDERIMVSSWYPEEDFLEILRAVARLMPDPGIDVFEFMGRMSARADLGGVYAPLLREGDPATTLRRTAITWEHYHDTGKEAVVDAGPTHTSLEISGFENPSKEVCATTKGWIHELVKLAGGRSIQVRHDACVLDGKGACRFDVKWIL